MMRNKLCGEEMRGTFRPGLGRGALARRVHVWSV